MVIIYNTYFFAVTQLMDNSLIYHSFRVTMMEKRPNLLQKKSITEEEKINELIYELYGLTKEEIKLLEIN